MHKLNDNISEMHDSDVSILPTQDAILQYLKIRKRPNLFIR